MNSSPRTPFLDSIEKHYPYRFSWVGMFITILVGGGLGGYLGKLALSEKNILLGLASVFFLLFFLYGVYILAWSILGNFKVKLTNDGMYVPNLWKWGSFIFVPFQSVTSVQYFKLQGNIYFQLSIGKKKYALVHSWFPHKGDFQEIVETVCGRLPDLVYQPPASPLNTDSE